MVDFTVTTNQQAGTSADMGRVNKSRGTRLDRVRDVHLVRDRAPARAAYTAVISDKMHFSTWKVYKFPRKIGSCGCWREHCATNNNPTVVSWYEWVPYWTLQRSPVDWSTLFVAHSVTRAVVW